MQRMAISMVVLGVLLACFASGCRSGHGLCDGSCGLGGRTTANAAPTEIYTESAGSSSRAAPAGSGSRAPYSQGSGSR